MEQAGISRELRKLNKQKVALQLIIQCTVLVSFALTIYSLVIFNVMRLVILSVIMCIYVLASYAIRDMVENEWVMLALTIAVPFTAFFIGNTAVLRGLSFIIAVAVSMFSWKVWINRTEANDMECISIYGAAVFIVEYMLLGQRGSDYNTFIIILCAAVFLVGHILHNNIVNIIEIVRNSANDPYFQAKRLRKMQVGIIKAVVVAMLLCIVFICNTAFDNIIGKAIMSLFYPIGYAIVWFINLFKFNGNQPTLEQESRLLYESISEVETETTTAESSEASSEAVTEMLEQSDGQSMQVFLVMSMLLLIVALIIVVVAIIVGAYMKYKATRNEGADEIEYIAHDNHDNAVWEEEEIKEAEINMRLRRHYRKNVLRGYRKNAGFRNKTVPEANTLPDKLTKKGITAESGKAEEITRVYEKARYSNQQITEEEMNIAKEYMEKKSQSNNKSTVSK